MAQRLSTVTLSFVRLTYTAVKKLTVTQLVKKKLLAVINRGISSCSQQFATALSPKARLIHSPASNPLCVRNCNLVSIQSTLSLSLFSRLKSNSLRISHLLGRATCPVHLTIPRHCRHTTLCRSAEHCIFINVSCTDIK